MARSRQPRRSLARLLLPRRAAMAAADAGHDVRDVSVLAVEPLALGAIGGADRREFPLDRRDGAGIDAVAGRERREIEPDHLRVRGVGAKTLAAAPAAKQLP